jgi:hypothetical protein
MTNFSTITPEMAEIDKTVALLLAKRAQLSAKEATKKVKALASEIAKRKSK